jgi:sorbitol-specific phosphotransferase system component IIA
MRKRIAVTVVILAFASPFVVCAADHSGHVMEHASSVAHEEVVDGVKVTFNVQTMAAAMKAMGMEMPKGVVETHHISVSFKDAKSGKALTEGTVAVKLQTPDKTVQSKDMTGMHGHFGADFVMASKGKYGVMSKFQLKDGKTRQARFWYSVQ